MAPERVRWTKPALRRYPSGNRAVTVPRVQGPAPGIPVSPQLQFVCISLQVVSITRKGKQDGPEQSQAPACDGLDQESVAVLFTLVLTASVILSIQPP